jgi:hypothetical protein
MTGEIGKGHLSFAVRHKTYFSRGAKLVRAWTNGFVGFMCPDELKVIRTAFLSELPDALFPATEMIQAAWRQNRLHSRRISQKALPSASRF